MAKRSVSGRRTFPMCSLNMGPIMNLSGPRTPVLLPKRAFGRDCFDVYYQSMIHRTAIITNPCNKKSENETKAMSPRIHAGGTWESRQKYL